ncbi:hypothetical protein [Parasphingopyxis sp.]|uniref:hypothetical protein n=1 Tax=Parasphingopyxis sp. TaxID=1920299 RepID=UPI0026199DE3|nr:hypothetical protein [Parasphingopyxis sp.]
MNDEPVETFDDTRQEHANRVRIGATGLASIVVIVLLAASFSGTASNEPELTPEAMAEQAEQADTELAAEEEQPQEPLAELGVAPGTGPVEETEVEPVPEFDDGEPAEN